MGKVLSCYWNIWINGVELSEARRKCVENLDIQEQCDGSDTFTFQVCDPNFLFIEDNIFIEDATVKAVIGWHDDTYRITFDGYISAIDIDFPQDGFPVLSIFCMDESHVMNRKKKSRSWDNVARPEVVRKIAQEYGFKCVIEPGYIFTVQDTISQSDTTDIEFCENLASEERVPFMCKLIGDTLYYVKKGLLKSPVATMYYKRFPYDVVSFTPKINKETRKEEISVGNVSTITKDLNFATANDNVTSRDVLGESLSSITPNTSVAGNNNTQPSYTYNPKTGKWEVSK